MDKKLFYSIITVLVLLGALWVFAGVISGGIVATYGETNLTTNGTKVNWTEGSVDWVAGTYGQRENITFKIKLNHVTATNIDANNISNLTIKLISSPSYVNITLLAANNTIVLANGSTVGDIPELSPKNFTCKVIRDDSVIQCLNMTAAASVPGNGTIYVWGWIGANSTGAEDTYTWRVEATDNNSDTSSLDVTNWGIDDLEPRVSGLSVYDSDHPRNLTGTDFNETVYLRAADLNVTLHLTEANRGMVALHWAWNGTLETGINDSGLEIDHSHRMTTGCVAAVTTSDAECLYSYEIPASEFSSGSSYSIIIWANDSFNHKANISNGDSNDAYSAGDGFNFTIDNSTPKADGFTFNPSKKIIFNTNPIKITCAASDTISPVEATIKITKPSGKIVEKIVTVIDDYEAEFKNQDTIEAGTYKVDCHVVDSVGWFKDAEPDSFKVYYSDAGAAEGVDEVPIADMVISTTEEFTGTVSGKQGEARTFSLDGVTTHTMSFLEVTYTSATIKLESNPVEMTLDVGKYRNADLDGDGADDVKVTLVSIDEDGRAKVEVINLVKMEEKIKEEREAGLPTVEEEPSRTGLLITILVILVIIVVGYYLMKKRKGKTGNVKFSKQDLGL